MASTTAYYTLDDSTDPARRDVLVTTEHPLSSYGQPVIVDGADAVPAQNFGHRLSRYFAAASAERDSAYALIDAANRLSGHGIPAIDDNAAMRDATRDWFAG